MYVKAGRVIYKRRHELDGFLNPWNEAPFASIVTTEVVITHEDRNTSDANVVKAGTAVGLDSQQQNDQIYSVNVEAAPQPRTGALQDIMNVRTMTREIAIADSNAEAWLYARVAFLFFFALAITWVSTPTLPCMPRPTPDKIHPRSPQASTASTACSTRTLPSA